MGLCIRGFPRGPASCIPVTVRLHRGEIAAQRFQRIPLRIDFTPGAHPFATQKQNWRTPALHRMLKEKWKYKAWNCEKLLVHEQAEDRARESQRRCVCLQPTLHVPFLVQLIYLVR